MLGKGHILAILVIVASFVTVSVFAVEKGVVHDQQNYDIPSWIKTTVGFWINGDASDQEFISTIQWMLENNILQVSTTQDDGDMQVLEKDVLRLTKENQRLKGDIKVLEKDISGFTQQNSESYTDYDYTEPQYNEVEINPEDYCYGNADCFVGTVTKIVDGDTIEVDGQSIRFALVNAPEIGSYGGSAAKNFVESVCPVGSTVLVDEDDGQTQGSYGRTIAIVYCNDLNYILNAAVIESGNAIIDTPYCSNSEFSSDYWALIYGCGYDEPSYTQQPKKESTQAPQPSCDPSYPDVCISPYPPDLNCGDIPYKKFKVVGSDPHGFDGDGDGIGCES